LTFCSRNGLEHHIAGLVGITAAGFICQPAYGTRSGTSINWTWVDNSPNETGFRLYGSTNPSGPFSLIADTNLLGPGSTSFNETSLSTGFTYYRYVAAVNQGSFVTSALSGVYVPGPSTLQLSVSKAGAEAVPLPALSAD